MNPIQTSLRYLWLALTLVWWAMGMCCIAGSPGPPIRESDLIQRIEKLRASRDEVMPGDNFSRRLRLAQALHGLGKFYNDRKEHEKADKSEAGVDSLRFYADSVAKDYMERGDLVKAKAHIDTAVQICRTHAKEKEVLPGVLTTLALWHKRMKQPKEAKAALLEAISLSGKFGFNQQIELARLYLETDQPDKAGKTIAELEKSTYKSTYAGSSVMFLRARWLRATGKAGEADALDAKARVKEAEEIEQRKNSQ